LEDIALFCFLVHEVAQPADWVVAAEDVAAVGFDEGQGWALLVDGVVEALGSLVLVEDG